MAAAVDNAFSDVMSWLAKHPEDCKSLKALAEALSDEVVDKLTEDLEPKSTPWLTRRQKLAHHFWCALLAAFAQAMKAVDDVPGKVAEFLTQHKKSTPWANVPDYLIKGAVQAAWKAIKNLPVFAGYDHALWTVRALAIVICPSPESHEEVFEYCVKPFIGDTVKPVLREETVRKLEHALPPGWV